MPDYYASEFFDAHPSERFPQWAVGFTIWQELGNGTPQTLPNILDHLVQLRLASNWGHAPLRCPRVFISHQKADAVRARDIASLAKTEGFDVWLDVLEPALHFPNRLAPTPEQRALAVATIVEMGLLNSTHVLALMTTAAERSRWVPYEYGRVKDSSMYSPNAACWIDSQLATATLPEYLLLGARTHSDLEISTWLQTELIAWQSIRPQCSGGLAQSDPNAVTPNSTSGDAPDEVRDKIVDAHRAVDVALTHDITVLRPLKLVKPLP